MNARAGLPMPPPSAPKRRALRPQIRMLFLADSFVLPNSGLA
jgi:hypothetical protein